MRYIYFSPHLDDTILSVGGLIHEQTRSGLPAEIWTFMAGFPRDDNLSDYAKATLSAWGGKGGEASLWIRREEDKKAAAVVGAKAVHFDFLDCIFRRDRNGNVLYTDVIAEPDPAEADLPAQIAQTMIAWLKPDDIAVCQLGIGDHVDHVIVRKAAEMLPRELMYDSDLPYSIRNPGDFKVKTAGMKEIVQPVGEAALESWMRAIEVYTTQMPSLFASVEQMHQEVHSFWKERKGLPFWKFE